MGRLSRLSTDRSGAAAAEMALVAPLLIILMFGAFETGKFFWDEHIVTKAVRDGARYASRQSFASMPCDGSAATNEAAIKNVVRYGNPAPSGTDKLLLYYWTSPSTVTVAIDCYANAGVDGARVYDGIYTARSDVPRVTVSATVPYTPLLSTIGFSSIGLNLKASSEATVFGL
jgi:Flp pilus assembly protein TadG